MLEVETPNQLRRKKLNDMVELVVQGFLKGEEVVIKNADSHANSVVEVAEMAKSVLAKENRVIFQSNELEQEPVFVPRDEKEPLKKEKVHYHKITFKITLSANPLPNKDNATFQTTGRSGTK